jgi:hypothetical protein
MSGKTLSEVEAAELLGKLGGNGKPYHRQTLRRWRKQGVPVPGSQSKIRLPAHPQLAGRNRHYYTEAECREFANRVLREASTEAAPAPVTVSPKLVSGTEPGGGHFSTEGSDVRTDTRLGPVRATRLHADGANFGAA